MRAADYNDIVEKLVAWRSGENNAVLQYFDRHLQIGMDDGEAGKTGKTGTVKFDVARAMQVITDVLAAQLRLLRFRRVYVDLDLTVMNDNWTDAGAKVRLVMATFLRSCHAKGIELHLLSRNTECDKTRPFLEPLGVREYTCMPRSEDNTVTKVERIDRHLRKAEGEAAAEDRYLLIDDTDENNFEKGWRTKPVGKASNIYCVMMKIGRFQDMAFLKSISEIALRLGAAWPPAQTGGARRKTAKAPKAAKAAKAPKATKAAKAASPAKAVRAARAVRAVRAVRTVRAAKTGGAAKTAGADAVINVTTGGATPQSRRRGRTNGSNGASGDVAFTAIAGGGIVLGLCAMVAFLGR